MKIHYNSSDLSNPTMIALMEWVKQCKEFIEEEDGIFHSFRELAEKLEEWRMEHQPEDPRHKKAVTVTLYQDDEILIQDQIRAEFIKVTKEKINV